jgi:hypothetical protein
MLNPKDQKESRLRKYARDSDDVILFTYEVRPENILESRKEKLEALRWRLWKLTHEVF